MSTRLGMGLISGLLGTALFVPPVASGAPEAKAFNPYSMYFVLGKHPKGLSQFQVFGLFREQSKARKPVLQGFVMMDRENPDGSTLSLRRIALNGRHLKFTTEPRRGMAFRFEGRFLYGGDVTRFSGKQIPVVEGTVTRLLNGKKTAQGKMRFYCEANAG